MNSYAGIGSRCTPDPILELMSQLSNTLSEQDWTLRSGHARGADQAFEYGAAGSAEIYLPWGTYEASAPMIGRIKRFHPTLDGVSLAQRFHPMGPHLPSAHLALHGRNSHIILGDDLKDPVKFVVCWTQDGTLDGKTPCAGGTGLALRIAGSLGIKVFNLALERHREWVADFVADWRSNPFQSEAAA